LTVPTIYDTIEQTVRDLYIRALQDIPHDVRAALQRGQQTEQEQHNETANQLMLTILNNIEAADRGGTLVCQDTGLPVIHVTVGSEAPIKVPELQAALARGCERATQERPLRSNTVHPLTRKHTGTNTGVGIPVVHFDFVSNSSEIEIQIAPKGSGSENMSFLSMLNPSDGIRGIHRFVLQCVFESGAQPCPPVIVGVGLGGTSDVAMRLAKRASSFRKIGTVSHDPDVARLERELLDNVNKTGIGPQGLGGATTALAVHIEWAHTHISHNPVAVNMQCWRGERAEAVVSADGKVHTPQNESIFLR
jgi:fumarate hydratase subunit alpha